jgi:hypothetical protein
MNELHINFIRRLVVVGNFNATDIVAPDILRNNNKKMADGSIDSDRHQLRLKTQQMGKTTD